jgi:hypothetical protein
MSSAQDAQYWSQYAHDARGLLMTLLYAGPTATRVWTTAWYEYAKLSAENQQQMAGRWNEIIKEPGRGIEILDQMRQDYKQYLVTAGGIPERAIQDFVEDMSSVPGTEDAAPPEPAVDFAETAGKLVDDTVNTINLLEESAKQIEDSGKASGSPAARAATTGGGIDARLRELAERRRALQEQATKLRHDLDELRRQARRP